MSGLTRRRLQRLCAGLCVASAAGVTGCKSWSPADLNLPGVTPYRIEIQQGNYVSQDMVAKLKRGMSRDQVRFVLGTPLVTDMFHADRWDYVFYRERPDKTRESRRLAVFFKDDRLDRVEGDVVPQGAAGKATETRAVESRELKASEARGEQGEAVKASETGVAQGEATDAPQNPPARGEERQ